MGDAVGGLAFPPLVFPPLPRLDLGWYSVVAVAIAAPSASRKGLATRPATDMLRSSATADGGAAAARAATRGRARRRTRWVARDIVARGWAREA